MSEVARWIAFAVGLLIVLGTAGSVVGCLVVPRRVDSKVTKLVDFVLDRAMLIGLAKVRRFEFRDRFLAWQAPLALVIRLGVWILMFGLGYSLLLLPSLQGDWPGSIAEAGSSVFTLGYAAPHSTGSTVIEYIAAFTGLIVVGLQVGYLPTLYSAFNRRETEVSLLIARAGLPAWGPEILARTLWGTGQGDVRPPLIDLFTRWERWTAEIVESHTTYPALLRLRSPQALANWLTSLIAVMDAAAVHLALAPETEPKLEARLVLRMGFQSLRQVAQMLGLPIQPQVDPEAPISVTKEQFIEAAEMLSKVGYPLDTSIDEAWPHFKGWRVNYDDAALALARELDAPPAMWTGPRRWPSDPIAPIRPAQGNLRR